MASSRAYAVVLAVALATSAGSVANGYVYDDVWVVERDPRVHSLGDVAGLFRQPYWGAEFQDRQYRPATTLSFAADWVLGGGRPWFSHAVNVALHLGVVALVLAIASRLLGAGGAGGAGAGGGAGAVVAGLWFAVHPVHVEAVASVVGRAELLAALGYLGAVLAYAAEDAGDDGRTGPRGARTALLVATVLVASALAFGAKEHALTLPGALLLADYWEARRTGERFTARWRRHALLWGAVVALAAGYLAARSAVAGSALGTASVAPGLDHTGALERLVVMLPALAEWARLLVFPLHLSADYSPDYFPVRPTPGAAHLLGAATIVAVVAGAAALRRRAPVVAVGVAWFAITVVVVSNVVVPIGVLLAERSLYLPSVGAALTVGALWELVHRTRLAWVATALALSLLGARSVERNTVWRTETAFYRALERDAPNSYRVHWSKGDRAFDAGRAALGERELLAAIATYPFHAALLQDLGERYLMAGAFARADRFLTAAYRVDSLWPDAAVRAVLARTKDGRAREAVELGEAALGRFPDDVSLLLAVADAWLELGEPLKALALRRRATYVMPLAWVFQHLAAHAAALSGRCEEARARLRRAAALGPSVEAPRALARRLRDGPTCGLDAR